MVGLNLSYVLKLSMAWVLGGLIGLERETTKRAAGLRTHILVTVGATLLTILSFDVFEMYSGRATPDPARIAAQIVSGIGFLGAGTILREGPTIRGLTTAASLWVSAAIGMSVGIGAYAPAVYTTLIVLISLIGLRRLETRFMPGKHVVLISVTGNDRPGLIGELGSTLGRLKVNITNIEMNPLPETEQVRIDFHVQLPRGMGVGTVTEMLKAVPDITGVEAG